MARNLSMLRQYVRQLLRDEFDPDVTADWEDDEIDLHIQNCLYEVSQASPYQAFEPLPVTADSKILDVGGLSDYFRIRHVEYEVGGDPRNYHNFDFLDNQTIEMLIDSKPDESGVDSTLTGTVTFTAESATVTGSGTDFDGELDKDYYIKPSGGSRWYRVLSVESDTSLTLDEPVKTADDGADTASATQYRDIVAIVYYDKLHTLTDEGSTLKPQEENALIRGVCGHTAISLSRSLINKVNIGGTSTPQLMKSWGETQLDLYQQSLRSISLRRISKQYSRG